MAYSNVPNILIYQRKLMHYRVPLFNELSKNCNLQLTVIACSVGEGIEKSNFQFKFHHLKSQKIGPFTRVVEFAKKSKGFQVLVLPYDLHELTTVQSVLNQTKPVVLWGHSHGSRTFLQVFRRILASRANTIVSYTKGGKEKLEEDGIPSKKIFVANNSMDIPNSGFNSKLKRTSFIFTGRLTKRKKLSEALIAFSQIQNEVPPELTFEIVGDGPERLNLESIAKTSGIESRVNFHGQIYESLTLKTLFEKSLGYISPGDVGLGVLHSFAYGVPLVTRQTANHGPEFEHISEGQNGLLYDGTATDLKTKMLLLANDSSLANQLGMNAYQHFMDHCSLSNTASGLANAIFHALGK